MLKKETFRYLEILEQNRSTNQIFQATEAYLNAVQNFKEFISTLITQVAEFDVHIEGLMADDCLFSTENSYTSPTYESHFGAYIAMGGTQSDYAGYYIYVKPGASFIGGGMYKPSKPVLRKIRNEIDRDPIFVMQMLQEPRFVELFGGLMGQLSENYPEGFPKDHPYIDILRRESYFISHPISNEELMAENALQTLSALCKEIYPFNCFLNESFVS